MEYEYRIADAAANQANADATNATKILKTLIRRLAKITPKSKLVTEGKIPREETAPRKLSSEMAEKIRERVN
ncbi:hypothetical protein CCR75_009216 [Bremia lactucae]|uniref:Uncharacterized protein n=1 Tax=Bremia lactucae TaxID=4779 RepID=A0A976FPN7_BRELC|nr:hypothetical protein CCR75_009216 [Bremia lactucae]